jgi:hypothetical protein
LKFPLFPVPLQKKHMELDVPEPRHDAHSRFGGCGDAPGPEDANRPDPPQLLHRPNIFPSQKLHLKLPLFPVPLQKLQVKLPVPEPRQTPHTLSAKH